MNQPHSKKVELKYRIALFKSENGFYTITTDDTELVKALKTYPNFVAWVTDPIPYQVEEWDEDSLELL